MSGPGPVEWKLHPNSSGRKNARSAMKGVPITAQIATKPQYNPMA